MAVVTENGSERRESALGPLIRNRARELGFDKVGIVPAGPLSAGSNLEEWLRRGFHAGMKWMARAPEQRADPRRLFPAARSVVVVAVNYYTEHQHEDYPASGKVSRYAWGDDYHEVLGEKLQQLLGWIKDVRPEAQGKVCVDIQPMLDKAWAVRAGLGWLGKHTNVITEEYGSWVFIGELLLNLELDYDTEQVADQCGACTLCLDACPTSAIVEPYVVDANRCISYATIESRELDFSREVADHLEGWLYGCDICQDVCPWNQMTPISRESRFEPRQDNVNTPLREIIALTPKTYAERFRRSSMKRAKLSGLHRNAKALLESGTADSTSR